MTDIATAAHAFKKAFRDAAVTLYAEDLNTAKVSVVFGRPTNFLEADVVAFTRLSSDQSPATLSTNRSREELLELDVIISCFVPGGEEAEEAASDRGYDLLRRLERFARMTDTTIGGTVRECFLLRHDSDGLSGKTVVKTGRNIFITATFQAKVRITT
jgi:hypothetical protein